MSGHRTVPVRVVAVEVPYYQEGEGGVGCRSGVNDGEEMEEVVRSASALRWEVDDCEEEGCAVLRTDHRTDDSGGGRVIGEEGGVDAVAVGGEGFDGAVGVVEEGDTSTTDAVLAGRGRAG